MDLLAHLGQLPVPSHRYRRSSWRSASGWGHLMFEWIMMLAMPLILCVIVLWLSTSAWHTAAAISGIVLMSLIILLRLRYPWLISRADLELIDAAQRLHHGGSGLDAARQVVADRLDREVATLRRHPEFLEFQAEVADICDLIDTHNAAADASLQVLQQMMAVLPTRDRTVDAVRAAMRRRMGLADPAPVPARPARWRRQLRLAGYWKGLWLRLIGDDSWAELVTMAAVLLVAIVTVVLLCIDTHDHVTEARRTQMILFASAVVTFMGGCVWPWLRRSISWPARTVFRSIARRLTLSQARMRDVRPLLDHASPALRRAALMRVERILASASLDALVGYMTDDDDRIRAYAVAELARRGS